VLDVVRTLLVVVLYFERLLEHCQARFIQVPDNKWFLTGPSLKSLSSRYDPFQLGFRDIISLQYFRLPCIIQMSDHFERSDYTSPQKAT